MRKLYESFQQSLDESLSFKDIALFIGKRGEKTRGTYLLMYRPDKLFELQKRVLS